MDPTAFAAWASLLRDGGFFALAVFALLASARGLYIWKGQHEQIVKLYEKQIAELEARLADALKERDRWMASAIRGTILAERATEVNEEVYDIVRSSQDSTPVRKRLRSEGSQHE